MTGKIIVIAIVGLAIITYTGVRCQQILSRLCYNQRHDSTRCR